MVFSKAADLIKKLKLVAKQYNVFTERFNMFQNDVISDISQKILDNIPEGVKSTFESLGSDMDNTIKVIVKQVVEKLDLVSREEFDVQSEILQRTRLKLEALEKQVTALEKKLDNNSPKD